MMHRANEVRMRQAPALVIGDAHERHAREAFKDRPDFGQVEPAVQRGEERRLLPAEQTEGPVIHVEVDQVELAGALAHLLHQQHMRRNGVADRRIQAQRPWPGGHQGRSGSRISTCEQRHLMPERHQFLGQERHNPFGAAVEFGWNCLVERSNLGDSHCNTTSHRREPDAGRRILQPDLIRLPLLRPTQPGHQARKLLTSWLRIRTDCVRRPSAHLARRSIAR
jgi:hypothetical protein